MIYLFFSVLSDLLSSDQNLLHSQTTASNHQCLPTNFLKITGQLIIISTYKYNSYPPKGLMEDTAPWVNGYEYRDVTLPAMDTIIAVFVCFASV